MLGHSGVKGKETEKWEGCLVDAKDSWQVFLAPVSLERLPVSLLISWGWVGSEAHLLQPAQYGVT